MEPVEPLCDMFFDAAYVQHGEDAKGNALLAQSEALSCLSLAN